MLHLIERDPGGFISQSLTLGHVNVMFRIFLMDSSNSHEFLFDCLSFNNLPDKVVLEFVSHHHIHVIRRKSCDAELHGVDIFSNILRECSRISLVLGCFLSLIESTVDITSGLTKSVLFDLLSFDIFHVTKICGYLLLEDLKFEWVNISLLVFFADLHILLETHHGIFYILRSCKIRENTSLILSTHFNCKSVETTLEITKRDGRPLLEVQVAKRVAEYLESRLDVDI